MKLRKLLALLLAVVLVLGLFAGCGKDKDQPADPGEENKGSASSQKPSQKPSEEPEIVKPKFAWKAEYVPLKTHEGEPVRYANNFAVKGDTVFYMATYVQKVEAGVDPETGEQILDEISGEPLVYEEYLEAIFAMNIATGEVRLLAETLQPELPEGYEGSSYVQKIFAGSDDTLWAVVNTSTYFFDLPENFNEETDFMWDYYTEGENYNTLVQYSLTGEQLQTIRPALPGDVYADQLLTDDKGYFYMGDWENVYVLNPDGTLKTTLTHPLGVGELMQLTVGQVGITIWSEDYTKRYFVPVDPEAGAFGEQIEVVTDGYQLQPGSGEYQYYFSDSDNIYGVPAGSLEGEKLLSWLDCDVDANNLDSAVIFLSDGRIAAMEHDYENPEGGVNLILLSQVDPSTVVQKQELVLGCFGLDWNLRPMVVEFNRSNPDVRIVVRDYYELIGDGTYEDAVQRMNTEILSGNAPDLLSLSTLNLEQFAAKGVLADLWPLIDSDPEISRDDLMTHLFEVLSIDGKLYQVTDSFSIQTAACRTALTGDRDSWTLEELLQAMENLQPDAGIFSETDTKTGILQQCLGFNLDSFMDWNTGTCSFDSEEFISILEFANTFPAEMDPNYDWATAESEYSRLMNGKQLMSTCYLSSFSDLQVQYAFHGGDVNFIGYPSANGTGSCFNLGTTLSISANCANIEAAWSFVRQLLTEEFQNQDRSWNFPTNKASFDALVEEQMTPVYYTDPETGEQVEQSNMGYGIGDDFSVEIYSMKQPEYDAFLKLYNNVKTVYSYDVDIMEIILEECEFFFAGQKTAEQTAEVIQNRLSLYVAEQR